MGASYIKAIAARQPQQLDPNAFKPKNGGNLDTISEGNVKTLEKNKGNALLNIITYKPMHLKKLSSDVRATSNKIKQNEEIRNAQATIVKEKVQATKESNPFSNPVEKQIGEHVNTKA